ncbi:hypothetical protein SAMN05443582_104365 [Phyllobacterium sp. OV277]|jgi:hypothetical protein|nr:hypothetical protein SAMN05443582_104365 [Phyllobacterium sp. OV277]
MLDLPPKYWASVGAALGKAKEQNGSLEEAVTTLTSWDELARASASALELSGASNSDSWLPFLRDDYARIRKFSAQFLSAVLLEASNQGTSLIEAI